MFHNITRIVKKKLAFYRFQTREGCHYVSVKTLSALLTGITSKHHSDFYCLNCLYSFATANKGESHKKVYKNEVFL